MRKNIFFVLCSVFLFASAAFAAPLDSFKGLKGTVDIAGGTAHIPVMKQAAQNISEVNPDVHITVGGGGSGVGVKQVAEGLVDIGNTGRPLKDSEIKQFGLKSFPFAIDGVAVVVNPKNTVRALTSAQIAAIYSGEIKDWKELGGKPGAINVYGREDGSGTRDTFTEKLLDKKALSSAVNVVSSNGAMKTTIKQDARGIGYVSIGHLEKGLVGVVVDGMKPSQENAASGKYTIVRYLYMNTKGEPKGLVATFINYIFSEDGKPIIRESGYIPVAKK